MVDPVNLKLTLIDFNVSKRYEDPETSKVVLMMTNTGDAKYQAPEMLNGVMCHYDERVDLWSTGAILYFLLTGGIHAFN
jgi:serine/threonine protein kinase